MGKGFSKKEMRISVILMGIILLEKVLSFAKNIIFAYFFGAQNSTDLYYLATNIVSLFNVCFCVSIPMAFLTVFINKGLREAVPKKQEEVMSNAISAFLIIAIVFTIILLLLAPIIENIIAPTDSIDPNQRLSIYIRILSFIVILYCFSGLLSSSLECIGNYIPSKLSSLFVSLAGVLFAVFLGHKYGAIVAVYGFLCGIGVHAIFSYCILKKERRIRLKIPKYDDNVKTILRLSFPMMISVAITSINSLVDKIIAVRIGEGAVSALNYSSLLSRELVTGVLVAAVSSIVTARFSENILHEEYDALNKNINIVLYIMALIVIPLTVFYFICSDRIIAFVFEHGAFNISARQLTVSAFIGYTFGLIFLPFREVFIRLQYAYQDSGNPMKISIISVFINIVLSIVFSFMFGIVGISIATSIATMASSILSYLSIKKVNKIKIKLDAIMYLKLLTSAVLVFGIARMCFAAINPDTLTGLVIMAVVVFGGFFVLSFVTNRKMFINALHVMKKSK